MTDSVSSKAFIGRTALCGLMLLGLSACTTTPKVQIVDRLFLVNSVSLQDLDRAIEDIHTRGIADAPVNILVKYHLTPPYLASATLAQEQGDAVKTYLEDHLTTDTKKPDIRIRISPAHVTPNRLWISYSVDLNKGSGIVMDKVPVPKKQKKPVAKGNDDTAIKQKKKVAEIKKTKTKQD